MRVDLTQSHDVLGWYQQLHGDYADIRTKYKDAGTKYAFSVLDGDVLAGYMIKLAAFRHIQDLVRSETDDSFDYHYNVREAKKILQFASVFPDVDTGEPMPLMPWEKFALTQLVGWRDHLGNKRYTTAILSVARGQGKTYLMAILMAYDFMIESIGLSNQDYLVASINWKQTSKLFGYIGTALNKMTMVDPWKSLATESGLKVQNDQIVMKNFNNVMRAISHESGQYDSFHFKTAVFDEIGEVKSREKIAKITSGQVKVPNKQFIQISTSYPDPTVPFHDDQKAGQQIMEQDWNRANDDNLVLVWAQDSLNETFKPETWVKSNPLLDLKGQHDVLLKGLTTERDTKMLQGDLPAFQTKNMNMWLAQSTDSFLNLADVESAVVPDFDIRGRQVYIGFDYSMMSDNTALAFVYPYVDPEGNGRWHIEQHSFIPWHKSGSIEAKEKQDGINYREAERLGYATITSHEQGMINDDEVYAWLLDYVEENDLDVLFFGYDAMGATNMVKMLENNSVFPLQPIRQRTGELKDATKFLQRIFVENSVDRLDDITMEKALLNAVLREDSVGIQVDKTKATLKIDVVDAIIDAMTQAMYHFEEFGMVNDATWQVEHMSAQQVADWFNSAESGLLDDY
ncbi:terminase large subunit [Weissella confusa]|uniref:Terminase large subunit n=1 Tax=Weissella confusa TaxID=1583 RepID=A0A4Z0RLP2_WEICO|nr:terminase TerL endonuclease subunit [Weissella confusa]COJ69160.1 terminase large subunit [Streptococcus pneumoniae]MBJ7633521.1 terminase large subunit [Weissella confusa]MBJ7638478.1 terminase large subunit [Weissella confusa]MBJ7646260.1 terminase large subunit [Weissella confusa]TGE52888.1 terminase [Weissella confusa]